MHTDDSRTQYLAAALIIIALISIGIADHFNMRDLANAGTMVLGIGGGILTGKYLSQTTTKGGGDIVNPTLPNPPSEG
jgi:type IV secretory pathway VirB2 component (pilin)